MNDNQSETQDSSSNRSLLLRFLYMILFAILFGISEFVLYIVAIVGLLFRLFTKSANPQVAAVGHTIGLYVSEIADFVSFNSETPPFPFSKWPSDGGGDPSKTPGESDTHPLDANAQ